MRINVQLPAAHSPEQATIINFFNDKSPDAPRFLWVACGTKFGKTFSGAELQVNGVLNSRNTVSRWVAPIYKQTRFGQRYMKMMLPPEPYTKFLKADMMFQIPYLNNEIELWHGQAPEDLEGAAIDFQINDECAKLKEQVHASSLTTMTRTRGKMANLSTPRGRNFFHKGCMRAKEEMARAIREKRKPKEIYVHAPTSANPFIPRESIEEARILLPDRLFRQYYLAEFLDDGAVFPGLQIDKQYWHAPHEKRGSTDFWLAPDADKKVVVAGCDWAKKSDYTVLTVWDYSKRPFRCVGFLRMFGTKYTDQVVAIAKFLARFKECEMLYHDKTGVGEAVDDMLEQVPGLTYHGITFTNAVKSKLVIDYITSIERNEIIFPWWEELTSEHDTYEVETNALGRVIFNATEGCHDDIVTSCYLGHAACLEYADKSFEIKILEDLPKIVTPVSPFEQYLNDATDFDLDEGF